MDLDENNSKSTLRYSLILEAYLFGNIPHMKQLHKQSEALNKMKALNKLVGLNCFFFCVCVRVYVFLRQFPTVLHERCFVTYTHEEFVGLNLGPCVK